MRLFFVVATAAAILWCRRAVVGGDTLVKIYRKVRALLRAPPPTPARAPAAAALAAHPGATADRLRTCAAPPRELLRRSAQVENPLAFYESRTERLLSMLHLHWFYMYLLIVPISALDADSPPLSLVERPSRRAAPRRSGS